MLHHVLEGSIEEFGRLFTIWNELVSIFEFQTFPKTEICFIALTSVICCSNMKKTINFLKLIITDDKNWIVYKNVEEQKRWNGSKYFESRHLWLKRSSVGFPQENSAIDSESYKLSDRFKLKSPEWINSKGVVFHHGNTRTHASLMTRQKLLPELAIFWSSFPVFTKLRC